MMVYLFLLLFVLTTFAQQPAVDKPNGEYTVTDVIHSPESDVGSTAWTKWSCPIPYVLSGSLTIDTGVILSAMDYITSKTGWTFVARTVESDYLNFYDDDGGCRSFKGKLGGPQNVYIDDDCPMVTVVHEIGHAIGIEHEQSRADRDSYVDINEANIIANMKHNFDIETTVNYGDYDYGSCMHYDRWAFTNDSNIQTITPISSTTGTCFIGQRSELSETDIIQFNALIDGPACSTPVATPCDATNIRFCGVDTPIPGYSSLFREYSIIGTHNSKNLYQSVTQIFTEYMIIYWNTGLFFWMIASDYELDTGIGYAYNADGNFIDSTNWMRYNGSFWVSDSTVSASNITCPDSPAPTQPSAAPTTAIPTIATSPPTTAEPTTSEPTLSCYDTNVVFDHDSEINYAEFIFREYEIIGTHNGENLYQSLTVYSTDYLIIYWDLNQNFWMVTWLDDLDTSSGYALNQDADFIGSSSWERWDGTSWVLDVTMSGTNIECPTQSPTNVPTSIPTSTPTKTPTGNPTRAPTSDPSATPTANPSSTPTDNPSKFPTSNPSETPTSNPSKSPTNQPTVAPTKYPTLTPTHIPTTTPTSVPTDIPSKTPSLNPSKLPTTNPSQFPTQFPTKYPTNIPSHTPTKTPTNNPSQTPSANPSTTPTDIPTKYPSTQPTFIPSNNPSTANPTRIPTQSPTKFPATTPTQFPTKFPSQNPSNAPTKQPTVSPTEQPSHMPTLNPTDYALSTDDSNSNSNNKGGTFAASIFGTGNVSMGIIVILSILCVVICIMAIVLILYVRHKKQKQKLKPKTAELTVLETLKGNLTKHKETQSRQHLMETNAQEKEMLSVDEDEEGNRVSFSI